MNVLIGTYLRAECTMKAEAIGFLQFVYLFSITLMELVGLLLACSSPLLCFLLEKKLQLCHVLINFQPQKAKKCQTEGVVLKVSVILQ